MTIRDRIIHTGSIALRAICSACGETGRVDTRPYEALRFGTLAQPISILPQGDRKFSILPFQFSIQQQDGGLGSGRPTAWTEQLRP